MTEKENKANFYFDKALKADNRKDYKTARKYYDKTIKYNPIFIDAYFNLALLLKDHFHEYEKAKQYYQKAIRINPNYTEAYCNLAIILETYFHEYKKAKQYYEKAIELNPNLFEVHHNLAALLYEQFKDIENAQRHFLRAIEINEKSDISRLVLREISTFEKETFISLFDIKNVRPQKDIKIEISDTKRKHLFLTGKNGSGKTSILKEAENYMTQILNIPIKEIYTEKGQREFWHDKGEYKLKFNVKSNLLNLRLKYEAGTYTIVFFGDERKIENKLKPVKSIDKIDFQQKYLPKENLSKDLLKFLFWQDYQKKSDIEVKRIESFFSRITSILKKIYKDDNLIFQPEIKGVNFGDNLNFSIQLSNRNKFNLNEMAAGYSAIFEIIFELLLRMENKPEKQNTEGIVLIDEPETHLHIDMQKEIMPILIELFPRIQFVVATHSPFILNSVANSVVYDLEKHIRAEDFSAYAYDGLVETYFDNDKYSNLIKQKLSDYKVLIEKEKLSEYEEEKLDDLEDYLEEIPAQVAIELKTEFLKLKSKK